MFDTTKKHGITIDFLFTICYYTTCNPERGFSFGTTT